MRPSFWRRRVAGASALLGLATLGTAASSHAQQAQWQDGGFQYIEGVACVVWIPETTVTAFAGYWGANDGSFPATGDVTYIRAAAGVVGNPCAGGDTIGFEFFPPTQTELAVSADTPVQCIATNLSTGATTSVDPNIHCLQNPEVGENGGAFFGYATVPSGWMFEIRVPVRFLRRLSGSSATEDQLQVVTSTAEGDVVTSVSPVVTYRPSIGYATPSATAEGGNSFEMHSYVYSYSQGGTFSVDLTEQPGNYTNGVNSYGPYAIPDGQVWNGVTTPITFNPEFSSTIYWRAKYTTSDGTYYGAEQVFQTNGATPTAHTLSVEKTGSGTGNVHSQSFDIDCGTTCGSDYTAGSSVTLAAVADPGSTFLGWSGACSGTDACVLTMSSNLTATAQFGVEQGVSYGSLSFAVDGLPSGPSGTMHVNGPSLTDYTVDLPSGIGQNLSDVSPGVYVANVDPVTFEGQLYLPRPVNVSTVVVTGGNGDLTAHYAIARAVSLTITGTGAGHVESSPAGIDCTTSCVGQFADGDVVELIAEPEAGSTFVGWTGPCSGQGVCEVTVDEALAVGAEFALPPVDDTGSSTDATSTAGASSDDDATSGVDTAPSSGATDVATDVPSTEPTYVTTEAATGVFTGTTSETTSPNDTNVSRDVASDAGAPPAETSANPAPSTTDDEPAGATTDETTEGDEETTEGDEETEEPTLSRDAAVATDAGADAGAGDFGQTTDDGCNCRVAGQPQSHGSTRGGYLGLALGVGVWLRRRAARSITPKAA